MYVTVKLVNKMYIWWHGNNSGIIAAKSESHSRGKMYLVEHEVVCCEKMDVNWNRKNYHVS